MTKSETGLTLSALERAIRIVSKSSFYAGSALLMIIMVLVTIDVVGRYFFNKPLLGGLEISEFLLAGAVLLGMGYTQFLGGNVMAEVVYDRLSAKTQARLRVFHLVVGICIFSLVAWQSGVMAVEAWQNKLTSDVLRIPAWPFRFFVPIGTSLLVLELFIQFMKDLAGSKEREQN
jgi:TRAP-type C4-dicarboxylate transport system permease small subunit